MVRPVLGPHSLRIAHRHRGFDDHIGFRGNGKHLFNHAFHRGRVKEVLLGIIIGGRSNDDIVRLPVGLLGIHSGPKIQCFILQETGDILVLNRRFSPIQHFHLGGHNIQCHNVVMLCQKQPVGNSHVACSGNGNLHAISPLYFSNTIHSIIPQKDRGMPTVPRVCYGLFGQKSVF